MKPPRRPRGLSPGESHLWREVAKRFTPLRGRTAIPEAEQGPPVAAPRMPERGPGPLAAPSRPNSPADRKAGANLRTPPKFVPPPPRVATAAPYQAPPQHPVPTAGLERQARLALKRGRVAIEARLDLHGMIQSEAHVALTGFLLRARAAGHGYVLVVTGKGGEAYADPYRERGVLRRSVPHWLRGPELRGIVLGFEEAARHHGGEGALYIRLRRR
ncbi:Smr/MutS family protein [Methylobacterium komagatae]